MWVNRTSSRMAIGALVSLLMASMTFGQDGLEGMQLGAPADCSTFGGPIEPNEGYFFQYDILYWSVSAPKTTTDRVRHTAAGVLLGWATDPTRPPAPYDPDRRYASGDEHSDHGDPQRRLQRWQPDRIRQHRGSQWLVHEHLPASESRRGTRIRPGRRSLQGSAAGPHRHATAGRWCRTPKPRWHAARGRYARCP